MPFPPISLSPTSLLLYAINFYSSFFSSSQISTLLYCIYFICSLFYLIPFLFNPLIQTEFIFPSYPPISSLQVYSLTGNSLYRLLSNPVFSHYLLLYIIIYHQLLNFFSPALFLFSLFYITLFSLATFYLETSFRHSLFPSISLTTSCYFTFICNSPFSTNSILHQLHSISLSYVMWNVHESKAGEFNFADEADIVEFLSLAKVVGLLVILRPGPYVCAEWEYVSYELGVGVC